MTKQYIVGNACAPEAGQTTFTSKDLQDILIDYILLNNDPLSQLTPTPDFTHYYKEGKISMSSVTWALGDKLIVVY